MYETGYCNHRPSPLTANLWKYQGPLEIIWPLELINTLLEETYIEDPVKHLQ